MNKKKPRIVIKAKHSSENINNDQDSKKENSDPDLESLKESFFKELRDMPFSLAQEFLTDRLKRNKIPTKHIETYIEDMSKDLNSISALEFAVKELRDFIQAQSTSTSTSEKSDDKSNSGSNSDPENLYPDDELQPDDYTENFEDFSDDPYDESNGLEGFVRESAGKTINLLNEILIRLMRLEERAELQKEINVDHSKKLDSLEQKNDMTEAKVTALPKFIKDTVEEVIGRHSQPTSPSGSQEFIIKEAGDIRTVTGVFPKEWPEMLELGSVRKNMLLVGPTGCGKSFIAEKLAEALGLKFYSMSCSEGMSEAEGKGWLLPLGANGTFIYLPSGFVTAYEEGGLFNADEFDAIDSNAGTWFNKALAGDNFYLPMRKDNSIVKKHKDFLWVACANTFGTGATTLYTGRNQLDRATLDRHLLGTVLMDYDPRVESEIVDPQILLWGQTCRKAMVQLSIDTKPCSTRFLKDATDMLRTYPEKWKLKTIEDKFFLSWEDDDVKRCRTVIKDIITHELSGAA